MKRMNAGHVRSMVDAEGKPKDEKRCQDCDGQFEKVHDKMGFVHAFRHEIKGYPRCIV